MNKISSCYQLTLAICFLGFFSFCSASAQTVNPDDGLSAYPNGGPQLVSFVSNSAIAFPTGSTEFIWAAETASVPVQNAIGAGLAAAYETLFSNGNTEEAGLIVVAVCRGSQTLAAAAFAAALRRPLVEICSGPWNNGSGPKPSLFRIRILGNNASPN